MKEINLEIKSIGNNLYKVYIDKSFYGDVTLADIISHLIEEFMELKPEEPSE